MSNPKECAEILYKAMKGLGTNEKKIIKVMAHLSHDGRIAVSHEYEHQYKKTLHKAFDSELSGNFLKVCQNLAKSIPEVKADYLHDAMKGLGTKDHPLIDAVCQSTNYELQAIDEIFKKKYGKDLCDEVESETSGNFRKVLKEILKFKRDENPNVNEEAAKHDADTLYKAGEKRWGTDDSTFVEIMTHRSPNHLQAIDRHYRALQGKSLVDAIASETSGDYRDALSALVKTRDVYFAERLNQSMKGLGTNDALLVYIMTSHDKPTLAWIAAAYQKLFSNTLEKDIKGDTTGDYEDVLVELLQPRP
eukprot:TRINITY_DN924_c0_g1_i1.p1 TRINITY_DN924_c0_g1~~TRINITY_DN924_c0_g1_i1.p1  ORF type:complete len:305 (-),score=97.75 TRINITY_DN924_c0_g1_i1:62-976(-)